MKLFNNVYFGDVLDSDEGNIHYSNVEADFVISDNFLKAFNNTSANTELTDLIETILEEVTDKELGYSPWVPSGVTIRKQYPALNNTVINNEDELREHIKNFVGSLCCFEI